MYTLLLSGLSYVQAGLDVLPALTGTTPTFHSVKTAAVAAGGATATTSCY